MSGIIYLFIYLFILFTDTLRVFRKKNSELVFKLVPALSYMLQDESPAVVKRVVQTSTLVYKVALKVRIFGL